MHFSIKNWSFTLLVIIWCLYLMTIYTKSQIIVIGITTYYIALKFYVCFRLTSLWRTRYIWTRSSNSSRITSNWWFIYIQTFIGDLHTSFFTVGSSLLSIVFQISCYQRRAASNTINFEHIVSNIFLVIGRILNCIIHILEPIRAIWLLKYFICWFLTLIVSRFWIVIISI